MKNFSISTIAYYRYTATLVVANRQSKILPTPPVNNLFKLRYWQSHYLETFHYKKLSITTGILVVLRNRK